MSRWQLWAGRPTEEKWKWLKELGGYPNQRPVRPSTEEQGLRHLGREAESLPGTEINYGETERDFDLVDRAEEPKITESEWDRSETRKTVFERRMDVGDQPDEMEDVG